MNEINLYQLIITLQLPSQHLFLAQKLTQHNQICHHFLPIKIQDLHYQHSTIRNTLKQDYIIGSCISHIF